MLEHVEEMCSSFFLRGSVCWEPYPAFVLFVVFSQKVCGLFCLLNRSAGFCYVLCRLLCQYIWGSIPESAFFMEGCGRA